MSDGSTGPLSESTGAETGFNTNVGFSSPGSPADEMGLDVMPPSGGVGAADPAAGEDIEGDAQGIDHGLVEEVRQGMTPMTPHLAGDIDPGRSNVSGPTNFEEGRR
jgi:hypothetical protein